MSAPYKHERWICERCSLEGRSESEARDHYGHPAGWKDEGNQHPRRDYPEFYADDGYPSESHPDKERGFFWTVDWRSVALEAARRYPEGHKRRTYWLERAAELPVLGSERAVSPYPEGAQTQTAKVRDREVARRIASLLIQSETPGASRPGFATSERTNPDASYPLDQTRAS